MCIYIYERINTANQRTDNENFYNITYIYKLYICLYEQAYWARGPIYIALIRNRFIHTLLDLYINCICISVKKNTIILYTKT